VKPRHHTGRSLAARLGYDPSVVAALPDVPLNRLPESATRSPFGGSNRARGEANARAFEVFGYAFTARRP
jgi:hypothetical protein